MTKTPRCIHPCMCSSDTDCPHYECGDSHCEACYPPEEIEEEDDEE